MELPQFIAPVNNYDISNKKLESRFLKTKTMNTNPSKRFVIKKDSLAKRNARKLKKKTQKRMRKMNKRKTIRRR
jgi:hypothetical protein